MNITSHPQFISFLKEIGEARSKKYNVAIISLPGSGSTYFIKKIISENLLPNTAYLTDQNQIINRFNFLDLDFDTNKRAFSIADNYLKIAPIDSKFAITVHSPDQLNRPEYLGSIIPGHIFKFIYVPQVDMARAKSMAQDSHIEINDLNLELILKRSGGVARLIKYFLIHQDKINMDLTELLQDIEFSSYFLSLISSIKNSDKLHLSKLGIIRENLYTSSLVRDYTDSDLYLRISTLPGGMVEEDKTPSKSKFLKHEIAIINKSIEKRGAITKEQISDIKWGANSYESFSDQAIKKIIQRLNKKLVMHRFKSIPTIGYQLTTKDD